MHVVALNGKLCATNNVRSVEVSKLNEAAFSEIGLTEMVPHSLGLQLSGNRQSNDVYTDLIEMNQR